MTTRTTTSTHRCRNDEPTAPEEGRPRLCFVGPMLGRNPGWVTTQGERLADQFAADGWWVRETSTQPRRLLRLLDTVCCLLRWRRDIDIVMLSVFSGPAFVMADVTSFVARLLRIPTIAVLRGGNLPAFSERHPRWVSRVLHRPDVVVAPSAFLTSGISLGDVPVEVVPNVIDLDALPCRLRSTVRPKLLWMRTFHPIYNPMLAVRALERLRTLHGSAVLTMAGQEKGMTAEVRREAERLDLTDVVEFAGFLDPQDKRRAFDEHDIYVHTNNIDNAPVSVLEAAAAGLPIVATEVGGIPDLLEHEHTALLVPDDDVDAMAAAITRLLEDPELAARLSRNGRTLAEASSWPVVRARWIELFEQVGAGS